MNLRRRPTLKSDFSGQEPKLFTLGLLLFFCCAVSAESVPGMALDSTSSLTTLKLNSIGTQPIPPTGNSKSLTTAAVNPVSRKTVVFLSDTGRPLAGVHVMIGQGTAEFLMSQADHLLTTDASGKAEVSYENEINPDELYLCIDYPAFKVRKAFFYKASEGKPIILNENPNSGLFLVTQPRTSPFAISNFAFIQGEVQFGRTKWTILPTERTAGRGKTICYLAPFEAMPTSLVLK